MGSDCLMGMESSSAVLQLDRDGGYTTSRMYLTSLNCPLENGEIVHSMLHVFCCQIRMAPLSAVHREGMWQWYGAMTFVPERLCGRWPDAVRQQSPTFSAPGTGVVEDDFSTDPAGDGGWFHGDSSALHLLCTLFLLLLHCNI